MRGLSIIQETESENAYLADDSQERERQKELLENIPCGAGFFDVIDGRLECIYLNKSTGILLKKHRMI